MRKQFLLFTLVLIGLLMLPSSGKAAVTPIAGNVDPEISTEAAPKWYTVMSSHITAADRQNRFLVWDGDRLRTEKFDTGIPEDQLEDKYLWRLEQGSADNKVYIVNKTGLRIFAPDGLDPTKNTSLTVNESGVEWEMKLTAETGQPDCADKQYCFNLLSAKTTPAYLNAMDFQNDIADKKYGITVYNAGVHQASGWFFYEANVQVTTQYTVTYDTPENGTIQVTNAQNEVINSNSSVDAETVLTITATPAEGYEIEYLKVNNVDFTSANTYIVNSNINISVAFKKSNVEITYCTPTFEKTGNVGIIMYASTEGAQTNLLYDNKANGNDHSAGKPNGLAGNQIEALQGSEISLNLFIDTWWGVAYVYTDINGNGSFEDSEKLGQWGSAETHGYEDHVNGIQCLVDGSAPSFTIPADLPVGTIFRARVIMGSSEESTACGTWKEGSYYDFEIKVVAAASEQFTITLPESVENGTLTVKAGDVDIINGTKIDKGTVLTITATPASGYVLDYLKVNDTPLSGNTYTVTENTTIAVAFIEEPVEAAPKAIHVPANDGSIKYQFRFDDIVLGEHENGTNNKWENGEIVDRGDHRARNFTMSVWIKPLNKEGELFGHAQAPFYGAQGTFGVSVNSDNKLVLKARAWLNEGDCNGIRDLVSNATLNIDEWAFLTVAVDDDARSIKLYKNGELLATGDLSVTSEGLEAHGIGLLQDECVFFAGNGNSSCDVDEVQVWNKTLTDSEIKASMESFTTAPENLIAFYTFDENSIENIPNKGTGVECTAGLVSGTVKRVEAPYWADVYTCTPVQATLVDGHVLPKFAVNYVSETDHGTFIIKNGDEVITSGSKVSKYSTLTIEATPAEGYQVKSIKVNDMEIDGYTFVLEEESTVTVEFTDNSSPLWKVTCNITGEGTVKIEDEKGNIHENGASTITEGSAVTLTLTPETGYELSDLMIDGTSYMHLVTDNQFRFEIDTDYTFDVVFIKVTSLQNTSADAVSVRYAAGTLHVIGMNAGDKLDIYDIAGNYVRTSEVADTNVSDLADGCYLVKVTTGNTIKTVKFIKK